MDIELNEDQTNALDSAIKFIIHDSNDMALLEGPAGSGKTTTLQFLIQRIFKEAMFDNIVLAAPTHKALKVMKKMCDPELKEKLAFSTLHSLLGMRQQITKDGKEIFVRDTKIMPKLHLYDVIIIDEASMVADQLFNEIVDQNYRGSKVLFIGDSNQINPINHIHAIPMLERGRVENDISHFKLTKIVRQAQDNPIIKFSQKVLNDEFKFQAGLKEMVDQSGIVMIGYKQQDVIHTLLKHYFCCEAFDKDADHCRVIAWRNKTVDSYNNLIRAFKYGRNVGKIVEGEKLIVDRPIKRYPTDLETLFNTNEDLIVKEIKMTTKLVNNVEFHIYHANVQGDEETDWIDIIHEKSQRLYDKCLQDLAEDAKAETDNYKKMQKWKKYYEFIESFAHTKYGYSITIHNSQGSTFGNCFVVYTDLIANRKTEEQKRILYTAVTRPKKMLFML